MKVFVTGGSGFTGRHVVRMAAAAGHEVYALARRPAAAEVITRCGVTAVAGDLDDPENLPEAFAVGADALLNVASLGYGHGPSIVRAAEEAGITRAVFVSTTGITTKLAAPSLRIRLEAEDAIHASSLQWTIIRPTMIYGEPGDRNMERLLRLLRKTPIVPLPGGGRRLQQPVHVADLAAVIVAALNAPDAVGRTYDVAGPEPMSLRELVREAADAVGRRPRVIAVPLRPVVAAARLHERLSARPRLRAEQVERLAEDKTFDIDAAARDLGFRPRSFREGIRAEAAALA